MGLFDSSDGPSAKNIGFEEGDKIRTTATRKRIIDEEAEVVLYAVKIRGGANTQDEFELTAVPLEDTALTLDDA